MSSPVGNFEHDHLHINNMVAELRELVVEFRKEAEPSKARLTQFATELDDLRDVLLVHFAREEEALFPFITRVLPAFVSTVRQMEATHDAICGAVSRMAHLVPNVENGGAAEGEALLALFERFDRAYASHAQAERNFLREVGRHLTADQALELATLIEEI